MRRNLLLIVLFVGIALAFSACGGDTPEQKSQEPAKKATSAPNKEEGIAVAKEILETFDKAVAEAVELAKKFGDVDSPRFVNGILDKIYKTESKIK